MSTKKTDQTLQKCDELIDRLNELKKAIGSINVQSNRTPVNALGVGWSQDPGTGAFHHSTHGVISTFVHPEGGFEVRHGGRSIGRVAQIGEAGNMIRGYVGKLGPMDTGMKNRPSPQIPTNMKAGTPTYNQPPLVNATMAKSGYGPKGAGLYDHKVNDSRKRNNLSDERVAGAGGPNASVKAISTKPGQLSAKQQAAAEAGKTKKLSGPVKQYTPAQIAALEEARKLKKNSEDAPWVQHGQVPNADEQVELIKKTNPVALGEDAMATQLANMMHGKAMMRPDHRQPTSEDMIMAGQAMGLVPTEEMAKAQEQKWGNTMNWLQEAVKPISARFASEEEELAYWSSIKVNGGGGGDYGF